MKRLKLLNFPNNLLILIAVGFMAIALVPVGEGCGIERREVKALLDKDASQIKWTPITSNIKTLVSFVQPFPVKDKKFNKNVRFGYEFNVYEIKCKIREFRKEDDGDYHLVLVDINDSTRTMIGEILNPECPDLLNSQYTSALNNAREEFEMFKLPKNKVMEGIYTITGVCFFDHIHGQLGVAPNGVEIHPIMDIVTDFK